jgi:hypothetical protein
MRSVSKPLTNAEKLRRHHDGVATRLERIEAAVEDLREVVLGVLAERQRAQQGEQGQQQQPA